MRYLLDVNALVALGFLQHEFHQRVAHCITAWASEGLPELMTCSITELGFVRVLAQAPQYAFTVFDARTLLLRLKIENTVKFTFIPDDHDVSQLPGWVKTPKQITDGHLAQLAKANGAMLATLDAGIPKAFLIPRSK
jgi:predicted nucleic acid-binding protein